MTEPQKKPGVTFRATVALVVVLAYPLSFGPACWISSWTNTGAEMLPVVYSPMIWELKRQTRMNRSVDGALNWYCTIGAAEKWTWSVDVDVDDGEWKWKLVWGR